MNIPNTDYQNLIINLYKGMLHREPEPGAVEHWVKQINKGLSINDIIDHFLKSDEFNRIRCKARKLLFPPGHFYSPIVNVDEVRPLFAKNVLPPEQLPGITIDRQAMLTLWKQLKPHLQNISFPEEQNTTSRYYFKNPAFSYGDGSILSAMLQYFQPKRVVEVGCGYSSACAMDTIDNHLDGKVAVSFIEPHPELLVKLLGKDTLKRVEIHACRVQEAEIGLFTQLESGDFLFIDSTHIMETGSDVCHELFTVLPALKPGVFVHFHDIFWPFEYSAEWVLNENRSWNEIYGLRAFLMYNNAFEFVFFNDYFVKYCRDTIEADYPTMLKNGGCSIWLRKK